MIKTLLKAMIMTTTPTTKKRAITITLLKATIMTMTTIA